MGDGVVEMFGFFFFFQGLLGDWGVEGGSYPRKKGGGELKRESDEDGAVCGEGGSYHAGGGSRLWRLLTGAVIVPCATFLYFGVGFVASVASSSFTQLLTSLSPKSNPAPSACSIPFERPFEYVFDRE